MRHLKARKQMMVTAEEALPGRPVPITVPGRHFVLGTSMAPPYPAGLEQSQFAMGCFWGAERVFWTLPGVFTTAVGYAGGYTENPTYEEVCSGRTGHTESVLVVFDPALLTYSALLQAFFEAHDPTQYMGQGNDIGTQYRSAIFTTTAGQGELAATAFGRYGERLRAAGFGAVTTEVAPAGPFYVAEDYHQQYLAKNPNGYCGLGGTGVSCPIGLFEAEPH